MSVEQLRLENSVVVIEDDGEVRVERDTGERERAELDAETVERLREVAE